MSLKDSAERMKEDIHMHITEQLTTQRCLLCLSETLGTTILKKLTEKDEGMFCWVQCQLDVLECCPRTIDIKNALNNLPPGLNEMYDRIILAIKERGSGYEENARSCLFWLASAFTPLTLNQLNEAMMIVVRKSSLDPDLCINNPMDIMVACGSLVAYDEKTGVVALSHYSVKEYLISDRPDNILQLISDMHARICELLITKDHLLLNYAIQGWKHLGHVEDEDLDIMVALSQLHSEFLQNTKKHFRMQINIARYSKLISLKDTGHNEEREEKLLERCPPGHEGTKLVDTPMTILDVSGVIIAWYLLDALTDATQREIWVASNLLTPSLEKSVGVDGNWQTNREWFNQSSENVELTPGCINLSPAWFQQGHENQSDPEVSASLKGLSFENILKAIARPAAIATAALRVMHPEQGCKPQRKGRQQGTAKDVRDSAVLGIHV
ncbi:hypothetical protein EDB19DRAFT_1962017 [Suillus lakei]|nr:hypothetical protein EDB19DRAFT_1962017 [Suillus lakei]